MLRECRRSACSSSSSSLHDLPSGRERRRRDILLGSLVSSMPAAVLGAICPSLLLGNHGAAAAPAPVCAVSQAPPPRVDEVYSRYPYRSPLDIVDYVVDQAPVNSPDAVLQAIDDFSVAYPMYKIGPEKGAILDALVRLVRPRLAVELGSFVGYSAVRIARLLPPDGLLVCVEANPQCVAALRAVVSHAGLSAKVAVEQGLAGELVGRLRDKYGPAQLLFEDHCKPCYLPDLQLAESSGLLPPGSWTIADNVVYPGAPELLQYISNAEQYVAAVVPARYEYDQKWNPGWTPKADGMSVAVRVAGLSIEQQDAARSGLQALCAELQGGRDVQWLGPERVPQA